MEGKAVCKEDSERGWEVGEDKPLENRPPVNFLQLSPPPSFSLVSHSIATGWGGSVQNTGLCGTLAVLMAQETSRQFQLQLKCQASVCKPLSIEQDGVVAGRVGSN